MRVPPPCGVRFVCLLKFLSRAYTPGSCETDALHFLPQSFKVNCYYSSCNGRVCLNVITVESGNVRSEDELQMEIRCIPDMNEPWLILVVHACNLHQLTTINVFP